ncbi:MAG: hypothetical protein HPY74_19655 [Firmicutes bacterium]|nr:hypothetical protein [Bacillota bacterium]
MDIGGRYNIIIKPYKLSKKVVKHTGKLIYVHPEGRHAVFDIGNYKLTISRADIMTGEVELRLEGSQYLIKALDPKIEREVRKLANKEAKITREQLLEECQRYGTNFESARIIGEKYGLAKYTVYTYITKWCIREALKGEKSETNKGDEGKVKIKKDSPVEVKVNKLDTKTEEPETEIPVATMDDEGDCRSSIDPGIKVGFTIEKPYIDAFQLKRSGRFEKGKVVNILTGIANMLKDEEDGEYMVYVDLCQR